MCKVAGFGPTCYEDPDFKTDASREPLLDQIMMKVIDSIPSTLDYIIEEDFSLARIVDSVQVKLKMTLPSPLEMLNKLDSFRSTRKLNKLQESEMFQDIERTIITLREQPGNEDGNFSEKTFMNFVVRRWVKTDVTLHKMVDSYVRKRQGTLEDLFISLQSEIVSYNNRKPQS